MSTRFLRALEPGKHAILNPETGLHETLTADKQYPEDHPLVQAARWAFGTEEEIAEHRRAAEAGAVAIEPPVERATAGPGERRNTRRTR